MDTLTRCLFCVQNLREEVAMDVDEDDSNTQQVKRVPDYGIEVDFSGLDEEDLEVSSLRLAYHLVPIATLALGRRGCTS